MKKTTQAALNAIAERGQIIVELQEHMGSDTAIANAAWTSTYDKDRREAKYDEPAKVDDIVKRIIRDGHNVPVESVQFRFWMRLPIFADRQHMTHRLQSANGLSGRYRTMPEDHYHLPRDVIDIVNLVDYKAGERMARQYDYICAAATKQYRDWLDWLKKARAAHVISEDEFKRVREIVRGQLPTAGMTERTFIMNLGSFANYQRKRNDEHAQPEIHFIAQEMLRQVEAAGIAPVAIATLKETGWRL